MTDDGCIITWWGHATVEIRLVGTRLITDPVLRRRVGPLVSIGHRPRTPDDADLPSVDAVLLSHLHHDHTDLPSLRRFGPTTTTVAPVGAGRFLRRHAHGPVVELGVGSEERIGPIRIAATPARHDGRRLGGQVAEAVGYLLLGSRTIYFAGDTDVFPSMATIAEASAGGLDVALLPVSGWGLTRGSGHMDPTAAAQAVLLLRPRVAIPIHWGTLRVPVAWRIRKQHLMGAAERFAAQVAQVAPATTVVIAEPGVPVELPSSAVTRR